MGKVKKSRKIRCKRFNAKKKVKELVWKLVKNRIWNTKTGKDWKIFSEVIKESGFRGIIKDQIKWNSLRGVKDGSIRRVIWVNCIKAHCTRATTSQFKIQENLKGKIGIKSWILLTYPDIWYLLKGKCYNTLLRSYVTERLMVKEGT